MTPASPPEKQSAGTRDGLSHAEQQKLTAVFAAALRTVVPVVPSLPDYTVRQIDPVHLNDVITVVIRAPQLDTYASDYRLLYAVCHQPATSSAYLQNPPMSYTPLSETNV
jgi:hypothetical protein